MVRDSARERRKLLLVLCRFSAGVPTRDMEAPPASCPWFSLVSSFNVHKLLKLVIFTITDFTASKVFDGS